MNLLHCLLFACFIYFSCYWGSFHMVAPLQAVFCIFCCSVLFIFHYEIFSSVMFIRFYSLCPILQNYFFGLFPSDFGLVLVFTIYLHDFFLIFDHVHLDSRLCCLILLVCFSRLFLMLSLCISFTLFPFCIF